MTDALLKAKSHFAKFRSSEMLLEIKVPEWDMSIWYWPHLSVGERRAIQLGGQAGTLVSDASKMIFDTQGRQVAELIARARDVQGKLVFHESQFTELMSVDPGVVERITAEMKDEYSEPEEAAKNS